MGPSLIAAVVLVAAPMKLVVPTLNSAGVDESRVRIYTTHLAQGLRAHGVEVFTSDEMGSLLGAERQRQLLGCASEGSSCLAELSNALGAPVS